VEYTSIDYVEIFAHIQLEVGLFVGREGCPTCCIETGTLIYYNVLKLSLIVYVFLVGVPLYAGGIYHRKG